MEIVRRGQIENLTDHLNQADESGSIKFTHEEENDGQIPFLDTLLVRRENGTVKLLVYRKPTHTDQYLAFDSHHPLHQKLGVVRTLLDRKDRVITDESDKIKEEEHIRQALARCGYPAWTVDKVKQDMEKKEEKKKQKSKKKDEKSKSKVGYWSILRISRIGKKRYVNVCTASHVKTVKKCMWERQEECLVRDWKST